MSEFFHIRIVKSQLKEYQLPDLLF